MQITQAPPGSEGVLHPAPAACNGGEVVSPMGGEQMQLKLSVTVCQSRSPLVGAMEATAVAHQHHCFPRVATDTHDLMAVLAEVLRITMGADVVEHARGAILNSPNDGEQPPAGEALHERYCPHL